MVNTGMMPTLQLSPSSPVMRSMTQFMTAGQRKGFGDFRGLLETHIDFAEIASWGPRPGRPVLILGAANVTSGALAKFVSSREAIKVEHILASCAVPSIFPAVQIGADAYWDGLFSDNPPVEELIRPRSMGDENSPGRDLADQDQPDRAAERAGQGGRDHRPAQPARGQHLAVPAARPSRDDQRHDHGRRLPAGIPRPVRHQGAGAHPQVVPQRPDKPYHIPCIEMPVELQDLLDYEGKIDRGPDNINRLIAEGEKAATRFLEQRAAPSPPRRSATARPPGSRPRS
jgi:NTE family protein